MEDLNSAELAKFYLNKVADALEKAERLGAELDIPEGARYIQLSDILAREITERLRKIAERM